MARRALITGINGQDGGYLSRLLLDKGYEVHGTGRNSASTRQLRAMGIDGRIRHHTLDLTDTSAIERLIDAVAPDEIYNLGGPSFLGNSFDWPIDSCDASALGPMRILGAIRKSGAPVRFYQASSSEMFGRAATSPQDEQTAFRPRSPYATAKAFGHWTTVNFREAFGIFACSGVLYNHESPWRSEKFVTRKITTGFAAIRHGSGEPVRLGNLDAQRDWGFAGDYVEGMWRMLQQDTPQDFVLATGQTHTVRQFAECAALAFGWKLAWRGTGLAEEGYDRSSGRILVKVAQEFWRPAEETVLCGSPARAEQVLGWRRTLAMPEIAALMAEADDRRAREVA
ncbi:MAG TPA: GDP-mannose 4,6-dehydratase [Bauldia sp.]|nr:GDP-mannose 4,6-dehydratase [Bauldia sp.]